jgi:3-oxoacyl-[acyl-carrier-protein] synthase-3
MEDRTTCILFGDGAAAAIVRRTESSTRRLIAARWGCDGGGAEQICVPGGGSRWPASIESVNGRMHFLKMRGREVYKFAVMRMQELISETLAEGGATIDDLALIVPHQSNRRIIESACGKLRIPEEKVLINIDRYGNTSAASVPIALHEARDTGRAKPGDLILLVAFGAGLTWASALLRL